MNKAERLNQELIFLNFKNFFQINDLMTEFHISKRTALRDISELEQMGLSFYVENGRAGGYHLLNKELLIPITFNLEEVNAIFFALKALKILSATPFEKSYSHIYDKLMASLPKQQQENIAKQQQVISYYNATTISSPKFLNLILEAILDEKVIDVSFTNNRPDEQIQVYDLFYRNGVWLCSAYNINQKQWGTYRCDRFKTCVINQDITETYTRQQLQQFGIDYEKNYHNIPFSIKLNQAGTETFLKNHYPNMHFKQIDGQNYIRGGYNQTEFDYMVHYVISLGTNAIIEYPKELRDAYLSELHKIIDRY